MSTVIHQSELLRRAVAWIDQMRRERPGAGLSTLLDEAGMRFNIGPGEAADLERLFRQRKNEN